MRVIILIMCLILVGCPGNDQEVKSYGDKVDGYASVFDYGNGVYYFGSTGAAFAVSLGNFAKDHKIVAVVPNPAEGTHNSYLGYFVVTEKEVK